MLHMRLCKASMITSHTAKYLVRVTKYHSLWNVGDGSVRRRPFLCRGKGCLLGRVDMPSRAPEWDTWHQGSVRLVCEPKDGLLQRIRQ